MVAELYALYPWGSPLCIFDVTDADSAKRWLKMTVQAFCSCQFDKLCTLQLYAINLIIKKCAAIPLVHKLAMQEAVNDVYSANSNVFESTMLSLGNNFKAPWHWLHLVAG